MEKSDTANAAAVCVKNSTGVSQNWSVYRYCLVDGSVDARRQFSRKKRATAFGRVPAESSGSGVWEKRKKTQEEEKEKELARENKDFSLITALARGCRGR